LTTTRTPPMKIDRDGGTITVELDGEKLEYRKQEFSDEDTYFGENSMWRMAEWKVDLVKNHGVNPSEL